MANVVLDPNTAVNEFELKLRYRVQFRIHTFGKDVIHLCQRRCELNFTTTVSSKVGVGIK